LWRIVSHGREPILEPAKSVKEWQRERGEMIANPIPHPPVLLRGGGGRVNRGEAELRKKGGVGGKVFLTFVFIFLIILL